jgi:hypothetical protein
LYNPDEIFEHFLVSKRSVNALATAGEDPVIVVLRGWDRQLFGNPQQVDGKRCDFRVLQSAAAS